LTRPLDARVETALADTIRGDEVVDVKFYAYTRAGSSYVARPRPMFAKMALLRGHSDILDAYLAGISGQGFAESQFVDLDAHVLHDEERFTDYDYMSDSDLDTDDEEDGPISGRLSPGPIEAGPIPPDSIPLPSTDDEENLKSPLQSFNHFPGFNSCPQHPHSSSSPALGPCGDNKGHAYKTWNALLYYLYTKKVVFRALKSTKKRKFTKARPAPGPLECSPKSMYKLADAFGLTELKALGLASLKSQLSAKNIVREAFSSFTSVYTDVQDIETVVLIQHLPNVTDEMEAMLRSICDGTRPQCFNMLDKVVFWDVTKVKLSDFDTWDAAKDDHDLGVLIV